MFDSKGNIKTYNPKSLITLDIIYPILAVFSYYLFLILRKTMIK